MTDGGAPARRAVVRWAWRLFRREWRQQLLILALIAVAVAATILGAAVAADSPAPPAQLFGTAEARASFPGSDPNLAAQVAELRARFGPLDVIENETQPIPGSVQSFQLRAEDPTGPYGGPLLSLVGGRYPSGPGQVAMTSSLASTLGLRVGQDWRFGGASRRLVGIVRNPQSLLDDFALVAPGQVPAPTEVTVLFDAPGGRSRPPSPPTSRCGGRPPARPCSTPRPSPWPGSRSGCCS